ncbi:MAG: carbohydrate kinase family protein [Ktedonobacteraceae bacterium]
MHGSHFDVLVIGTPCVDIVFGGMPHWPALGKEMYVGKFAVSVGSVFNTAATLSRLGMHIALLCELGNDFFSRFILEEMEKAGISRELVIIHNRPQFSVSVCLAHEGERGFVSYSNMESAIVARMVETAESDAEQQLDRDILAQKPRQLLADYTFDSVFAYARPAALPLLDMLTERNITLFLDAGWNPSELTDPLMLNAIRRGHYFMPNQLEAACITGEDAPESAACTLAALSPTVIVKMGERGVVACQQGQLTHCPAYPIEEVVDTTGAGDAFNGGFIYSILNGYSLADALRCGTICGSLSATALTGTAAVPTTEELERLRQSSE